MIRFVDIRNNGTGYRAAFFSTNVDSFLKFDGSRAWDNWNELEGYLDGDDDVDNALKIRIKRLCPDWFFNDGEDDVAEWLNKN